MPDYNYKWNLSEDASPDLFSLPLQDNIDINNIIVRIEPEYIGRWNKLDSEDADRLKAYLYVVLKYDWVKDEEDEKVKISRTVNNQKESITVSKDSKSLTITKNKSSAELKKGQTTIRNFEIYKKDNNELLYDKNIKNLVIEYTDSSSSPNVLAMVRGNVRQYSKQITQYSGSGINNPYKEYGTKLAIETIDFGIVLSFNFNRWLEWLEVALNTGDFSSGINYPIWGYNWTPAGCIPKRIIYENVIVNQPIASVEARKILGEMGDSENGSKLIKIAVEYADSTPKNPKFMHPKEFFSLLFWKEECDPVFADMSIQYSELIKNYHPLLQKMMLSKEDGTIINDSNLKNFDFSQLDDLNPAPKDNWLGLRPPLRTYKRVLWEAKREYLVCKGKCKNVWGKPGSNKGRIKNSLILDRGYKGFSKCNVFAGEMLFRAGFRTISGVFSYYNEKEKKYFYYTSCPVKNHIPGKLKYIQPNGLYSQRCKGLSNLNTYGKGKIRIENIFSNRDCFELNNIIGRDYEVNKGFARDRYRKCEIKENNKTKKLNEIKNNIINDSIEMGDVYLASNSKHVVVVANIGKKIKAVDQYLWKWEQGDYPHDWSPGDYVLIKILPGGDPTEEWGILDLNRLEE